MPVLQVRPYGKNELGALGGGLEQPIGWVEGGPKVQAVVAELAEQAPLLGGEPGCEELVFDGALGAQGGDHELHVGQRKVQGRLDLLGWHFEFSPG